ncbi:MAG: NADH-quinone oxidoreductase subunit C [Paracoccaceae bacterium]
MTETLMLIATSTQDFRTQPMMVQNVSHALWLQVVESLSDGRSTLLSLWASPESVTMALLENATNRVSVARVDVDKNSFPSVGRLHPAAQRLERSIADLFGITAEAAPDDRPWLDHGRWGVTHPMGDAGPQATIPPYSFLPVEGESLHQVAVGPVHAGIIEPGHFRFTVQGETVVRLEQRLGYTHKGTESLMAGATIARGAQLAGRTSGDSTVAYAWAFAQAVEAACETRVPDRALWLRALMAELERLANHLGDVGAICNDAAFGMMLAHCSILRERVLRTCDLCFGHRMMRDQVVPGGVAKDLTTADRGAITALAEEIRATFPSLVALYDQVASLQDRTVSTGILDPTLAKRFGAGGFVGRASGRDFDTRRDLAYAPYDKLRFTVPQRPEGDVNARIWQRIEEIEQSLSVIMQIVTQTPEGPISARLTVPRSAPEGLGLVEGFRGDVLIWVALNEEGRIARCHMRDPSWFQWPLLEAVIEGNIIADFPLCNKSFNCSYSGQDL